jgi:hypothetical protein
MAMVEMACLEDQLFLVVGFEDNRIFVKGTDAPRQFDADLPNR